MMVVKYSAFIYFFVPFILIFSLKKKKKSDFSLCHARVSKLLLTKR